jgi:hypothetical protein
MEKEASQNSCFRYNSLTGSPAGDAFKKPMISASENRVSMPTFSPESRLNQDHRGSHNGAQVT